MIIYQLILLLDLELQCMKIQHLGTNQFHFLAWQEESSELKTNMNEHEQLGTGKIILDHRNERHVSAQRVRYIYLCYDPVTAMT